MPANERAITSIATMPPATASKPGVASETARSRLGAVFGGSSQLGALLLYAAAIGGVYGAVLFIRYGFSDDYTYLYASLTGQMNAAVYQVVAGGRPLYALLLQLAIPQLSHVSDLWVLRLDSLLGITLFAWVLYQTLLRAGMNQFIAWLIPLFIAMLPAYQVFAGWAIAAFYPYSAVFAGMAVAVAGRSFEATGVRQFALGLGALALLLVSVTIYQPAAMVFWLFAAVILFVSDRPLRETIQRFLVLLAIMAVALLVDYGLSKTLPHLLYPHPVAFPRTALAEDVTSKLLFFLEPLLESLNLFHLVDKSHLAPSAAIALVVGLLILTGLPLYFQGSQTLRLQKTVLALSLIPLAYLPNLLVAENFGSFRSQVAMSSLLALYAVLGGIGYARHWPALSLRVALPILLLLTLASMGFAVRDITAEFAIPQAREYQAVVAQLRTAPLSGVDTIYVLPSLKTDRLSTEVHHDEFGLPTTSVISYLTSVVTLALHDVAPKDVGKIVIIGTPTVPAGAGTGVLVINMHAVLQKLLHPAALPAAPR
ncbi:MAG: hypothetical protein ACLQUY_18730 [Ktedonobacterales bacterium]